MKFRLAHLALAFMLVGFTALQNFLFSEKPSTIPEAATLKIGKQPSDWFFAQRAFPSGKIDKAAHLRAVRQTQALRALQKSNAASEWQPIGPRNIGGRITALAVHPFDPSIIYL